MFLVLSGLENSAHVLEQSGKMYSATLGLVDIVRGTNSYYKLQLLEDDVQKRSVLLQKLVLCLFPFYLRCHKWGNNNNCVRIIILT